MTPFAHPIPSIRVLRTRVDMVTISDAIDVMVRWIDTESHHAHHVVNTGMHGIIHAHRDLNFRTVLESCELLAPDGILAVLIARIHGYKIRKRDTGPGLLRKFSEVANRRGYTFYFYGDTAETLDLLSTKLVSEFPNLKIAGKQSPPFRPLTREEDRKAIASINETRPDVLWVGLGMPKQEQWIYDHKQELNVPVVVGAGASFKLVSGATPRAPSLICDFGFEWLWRLVQEPSRIWRRVVFDAPLFIVLVFLQLIGLKKFE